MSVADNRIEAGMKEWREHAKRLTDLFDDSILSHPNIKKVQLAHFREVLDRPLTNITKDEKLMKRALKAEVSRMEKVLYPSSVVRIARKIGRLFSGKPEKEKTAPAQLFFKDRPQKIKATTERNVQSAMKRNIAQVNTLAKKNSAKHDLLPKKRISQGQRIKR